MSITIEDINNALVDPTWIGVAAEIIYTLPRNVTPSESANLLFAALRRHLGTIDWITCVAVQSRISALGHMDHGVRTEDLFLPGNNPNADALCRAVAIAPLHADGEYLAFDPVSFQRCFAAARQNGTASPESKPEKTNLEENGMTAAEKARIAKQVNKRVQALLLAGVDDEALFAAMFDHMPAFKRLLDATEPGELDKLAGRFPAFGHYAALLTSIATGIRDGTIKVPR